MESDVELLERIRRVEARVAGQPLSSAPSLTPARVTEVLREQLAQSLAHEGATTHTVSVPDPWQRALFVALCRRYGLRPHRHARQRQSTVVFSAPPSFLRLVLWPEFEGIAQALTERFDAIATRVLLDVVDPDGPVLLETEEPSAAP